MMKNTALLNEHKKEKTETIKKDESSQEEARLPFSLHLIEHWAKFMIFC